MHTLLRAHVRWIRDSMSLRVPRCACGVSCADVRARVCVCVLCVVIVVMRHHPHPSPHLICLTFIIRCHEGSVQARLR